jgi:hypothetical protein
VSVPDDDVAGLACSDALQAATQRLWDRKADLLERESATRAVETAVADARVWARARGIDHIVYKRSTPFMNGDRYRPDLHDLQAIDPDAALVAIYRDPAASAHSAFRRGFEPTLGACAVTTAEHLALLAHQVETLGDRVFVLRYETFCSTPEAYREPLAAFCGIDPARVSVTIANDPPRPVRGDEWRDRTDAETAERLEAFMQTRRAWWAALGRRDLAVVSG